MALFSVSENPIITKTCISGGQDNLLGILSRRGLETAHDIKTVVRFIVPTCVPAAPYLVQTLTLRPFCKILWSPSPSTTPYPSEYLSLLLAIFNTPTPHSSLERIPTLLLAAEDQRVGRRRDDVELVWCYLSHGVLLYYR